MPIYQMNLWICEVCGTCATTTEEVSPFDDPVVGYPHGQQWKYWSDRETLACPNCKEPELPGRAWPRGEEE